LTSWPISVQGPKAIRWIDSRLVAAIACFILISSFASPAHAQQGDYLLGTNGLLGGAQPSEGVYYQNVWSYYHASGNQFLEANFSRCGPVFHRVCGTLNLSTQANGSLDLFVDQNIFGWTTPLTVLGAHYGFLIDLPFAIADASGAADLEPTLSLKRFTIPLSPLQNSGGSTKGSIGNMYIEPVNLGWHFKHLDAIISSGFFAPAGPYNSTELLNIGFGHWAGMFGLGGVFYPDAERTWSASVYAHYLLYGSQMSRSYTLGDEVPFEWGVAKSFTLPSTIFERLTVGPVGYAQWQVANNQIDLTPTTPIQATAISELENSRSRIYAAGPAIQLLTKYGLFNLRWYEEFGAQAAPSGQQLMFSFAVACDPNCLRGLFK
jgi:hypothetical protein